jgi:hypothetical protein
MTNLRLSACPSVLCVFVIFSTYKTSPVNGSNSGEVAVTTVRPVGLVARPFNGEPIAIVPFTFINLISFDV